mmetsp:Transcript_13868/g.25259  ORF Transcript_13868/g.25259 Transcript_13868/m.25259 type:complete len:238 (-) Transcript_13868:562-1275(-)
MDFINEENDIAGTVGDFLDHSLQAIFKLSTILGAGHKCTHVQSKYLPAFKTVRDIPCNDALGQPLGDCGLSHTRFTDQHWIVLGPPRQNLHAPPDFIVTPDHGVQLPVRCGLCQVSGVFRERLILRFRILAGDLGAATNLLDGILHFLFSQTELPKKFGTKSRVLAHRQKEVFHGDIIVPHLSFPVVSIQEDIVQGFAQIGLLSRGRVLLRLLLKEIVRPAQHCGRISFHLLDNGPR